ncbi:MAG: ABC transporter ATP-binding protein [Proteobacteria bacterium]|nr:ABC transporter ATP-binding protein [Pseudomonadota bacterium]MBI3495998.1 ABC transporter ATP-binding protein [Pseudomonadota bacterium]
MIGDRSEPDSPIRLVHRRTEGAPAIAVNRLTKRFGALPGAAAVLAEVDLSIETGSFVAIVGPSGCGKSTLLRLISGLIQPNEGSVRLFGHEPAAFRRREHIGFVFQDATLLPWRSVLGNVTLPLEILHLGDARERRARAVSELDRVRLSQFLDAYPSQLSGGMRQRVSIARALAYDPPILLMDEPFGALDEITRTELNGELLRVWSETGKTTVFVTHALSEALFLADEVVVMGIRPGHIRGTHRVDLPRPRLPGVRRSVAFLDQLGRLEALMAAATDAGHRVPAMGETGRP